MSTLFNKGGIIINKINAIGPKTLIGLKNKDNLITNLQKFIKSKARIDDFPSRL